MIINDLDGYYIVFDTKNWNTELDTLIIKYSHIFLIFECPRSVTNSHGANILLFSEQNKRKRVFNTKNLKMGMKSPDALLHRG